MLKYFTKIAHKLHHNPLPQPWAIDPYKWIKFLEGNHRTSITRQQAPIKY